MPCHSALVAARNALAIEILRNEVPIHEIAQHRFGEVRAGVAIIDVVCVLPHIEREQWHHTVMGHRGVAIVQPFYLERAVVEQQPDPAAAKMRSRLLRNRSAQRIGGAESAFDQGSKLPGRLPGIRKDKLNGRKFLLSLFPEQQNSQNNHQDNHESVEMKVRKPSGMAPAK